MTLWPHSIEPGWDAQLAAAFDAPSMTKLGHFLETARAANQTIYPPQINMFAALSLTPFDKVKAVIIGQDPYHGPGQAHGLSFSVQGDTPIPPSLRNIFKEMESDLGTPPPKHGNLHAWAQAGVLLLNDCLTVAGGAPGSHQKQGWEDFTDRIIAALNDQRDHIVFILWGRMAQAKGRHIDRDRHLVIDGVHPSPLSAHRGFFGTKPFSRANSYLQTNGIAPIDWAL